MKLRKWLALRGPKYVGRRATILLDRYGITPSKAADRVEGCIATLAEYDCLPTLPTPGRVVERYPQFLRYLQEAGVEIAVHGYDHVDLGAYSLAQAREQLTRAVQAFARHGIEMHGFRCPYLSCTDDVLDVLPKDVFEYSSNKAIWWDVVSSTDEHSATAIFDALSRFYRATPADEKVCTPWTRTNMVEIPVSLPDDLQLHDGLNLGSEGMAQVWGQILHRTHRRGELFVLQFHPELASLCRPALAAMLRQAGRLRPRVWIARLRDISSWWQEKAGFAATVSYASTGLDITFTCSERATILARGLDDCGSATVWDGQYLRLDGRSLRVPGHCRPFVGLASDCAKGTASFLREQGYILDAGETASRCAVYIDSAVLDREASEVDLINYIESSAGPLVRYWRWPDGAKSAMCVTGDLDALSLVDYAQRLFIR
ncbi:MAG: polysaccharide deacetylase family protein [Anaerolineae bacterium]|nr:polysaccharide deacetylase family protein [Anaerolineae bacterium]